MNTTPRSTEQQAFDQALENTKPDLQDMADEALQDAADGLADPTRDDVW